MATPTSLYGAWQFVHPDAATNEVLGIKLSPLTHGIQLVYGTDSVEQALLILLTTTPGERVMRPQYGCQLHRLIFAPNDATTAGLAIHYVRSAIEQWEPRIEIVELDANPVSATDTNAVLQAQSSSDTDSLLEIRLVYRIRLTQQVEVLSFMFNLMGEGS